LSAAGCAPCMHHQIVLVWNEHCSVSGVCILHAADIKECIAWRTFYRIGMPHRRQLGRRRRRAAGRTQQEQRHQGLPAARSLQERAATGSCQAQPMAATL
jgi:hypothetical protein